LVCTDVEGSTAMWEWNSAAMQDAIFIHDIVLRKLMPEHCGVEVMTEGDAFIVAFHEEHDAVAYCLHAQVRGCLHLSGQCR
jgi:class 3 adenylate cyclase